MGEEHSFLLQGPPGPWLPCWSPWGTQLVIDTLIGCHTSDMQKRHICERHVKQLLREASGGEDAALPPLSPTRQELMTHLPGPAESGTRPQSARTNADALSSAPGRWRPSLPAAQRAPASPMGRSWGIPSRGVRFAGCVCSQLPEGAADFGSSFKA